ncbi:TetR/AcrR family transcriptional regulator [Paenibacillus barcinonensis]|uniref:TetR family transcriptional regulator n=1 Tax=Paenibacillus barcinonensis TaxID=198119 RepID=A0A2V4VU66_PAEBA|nr:TetR/AcrR family transcriptional regulator [Paenibacillus barcinonensis]PYE48463.1 TetR family transcriptional regulator [Paenibacillus barcinonensis]QKS58827.1 TetR/AcrR family transcriptional regulator [Paenibacillus barcinonensis]
MAPIDRRQQVIHAAAQSFAMFGYKATTMDQVAKIANVGKGTIYTFFTNKEQLFDQILIEVIQEMKKIADREVRKESSFFENLFRVLDALLEFRRDHELLVKLSHELKDFGTLQAKAGLDKVEKVISDFLANELERARDGGEIRDCDPQVVAFMMIRLYTALTTDWSKYHEPLSKDEIKSYFRLFLMEGIAFDNKAS